MTNTKIKAEQYTIRDWSPQGIFKGPLSLAVNLPVPKPWFDKMENFFSILAHLNLAMTENNPVLSFLRTSEFAPINRMLNLFVVK